MSDEPTLPSVGWIVSVVVATLVTSVGAGVVWWWTWEPPEGVAFGGRWLTDEVGYTASFSAVGLYIVCGTIGGLLIALVAVMRDRLPVTTLVVSMALALVAAVVSAQVGLSLTGPDPAELAASAVDGTPIDGRLELTGWSPYLAWPLGCLVGLIGANLARVMREPPPTPAVWEPASRSV